MTETPVTNVEIAPTFENIMQQIGEGDRMLTIESIYSIERLIEKLDRQNPTASNNGVPTLYRGLAQQVARRIDMLTQDKDAPPEAGMLNQDKNKHQKEKDKHQEELGLLYKLKKEYTRYGGM